jgi:hypothetical protein
MTNNNSNPNNKTNNSSASDLTRIQHSVDKETARITTPPKKK